MILCIDPCPQLKRLSVEFFYTPPWKNLRSVPTILFLNVFAKSPVGNSIDRNGRILSPQISNKSVAHLYFADKENNFLSAEKRILFYSDDTVDACRAIIVALIEGPKQGLMRTIPADTKLRAAFITEDATAYVDLTESVRDKHPGGSQSELFTIYSIVNSLILNISEIDSVKVLIGGHESMTLAGHVDLRFPFKANMLLVR